MSRTLTLLWFVFVGSFSVASSHTNPTYESCAPNYNYFEEVITVRDIDFRNLKFGRLCDKSPEFFRLVHGKSKVRSSYDGLVHDQAGLVAVHYFDLESGEPRFALATFWYITVGGSSSPSGVIQVFEIKDNHPAVIQQIEYNIRGEGARSTFNPKRGTLTVWSVHSWEHCCPKTLDEEHFTWTDSNFVLTGYRSVPMPQP